LIAGGREDRGAGTFGLHPIPSVIDLPTGAGVGVEVGGFGSGVGGVSKSLKMRVLGSGGVSNGEKMGNGNRDDKESAGKDGQISDVKHYDADGEFTSF
jgi:dihydrosphingosine 1-phosphate phosphatase